MFNTSVARSSKAKNENAGFATPHNKNLLSRKALFSDKPKMALGDLKKNTFNSVTPIKNVTIEKTKQIPLQLLSTPTIKHRNIIDSGMSTPQPQRRNVIDYTKDLVDVWNQKLELSDNQFDLLFINSPNIGITPPSPSPSPEPEPLPEPECPPYFPTNYDFEDVWDSKHLQTPPGDDYELPSLNMDFFNDNL